MATLLKRSDAPLYRIWVGNEWQLFAENLSHEQCFEVSAVLHAPGALGHDQDMVATAISKNGLTLQKNGWFEASEDLAMNVLTITLMRNPPCANVQCVAASPRKRRVKCAPATDCVCAPLVVDTPVTPLADNTDPKCADIPCNVSAPKKRRVKSAPVTDECCNTVAEPTPVTPPAENTDASGSDSPHSCVVAATDHEVDADPLWEHVDKCTARDAAKAVDVRCALEARFGKEAAKSLLANTKASVAQDASGRKNRVLKLGVSYISLKSV